MSELYGNVQLGAVTDILQARLLAVAIKSAAGVTEPERQKLLEQWERVSFRIFGLYGKDARAKVGDCVRIGYKIMTNDIETRTYNQTMNQLHGLGNDFPVEGAVEVGLAGKDFYESPDACRYLLWNYEEYLASKAGSAATFDEHERSAIWKARASDSIEHVFPQTPGDGWGEKMQDPQTGEELTLAHHVSRIGNLILLPLVLNSEAKALPFARKKLIYAKHNLRMVREVVTNDDWGYDMIVARESDLLDWARVRWADI